MNNLASTLSVLGACLAATLASAQTLTSVEAAEYEPNSDRWFVSNGSSILVTDDLGDTWTVFGSGGATHGMEVLGSTLFAIQNNVIRAYDVVTGDLLGSLAPTGVGFLNGMGSESGANGDVLVVSDFSSGRLLKVDVSDPATMTSSTLVANTGTTPNGVTVLDGVATVVNWGGNSDILQVNLETGDVTPLIENTGLGNCDGVDWANGSLVVSSWSPQRITRFEPDALNPGSWIATTLLEGSPLSNPADLSVNTAGDMYAVACSGNNTVHFGPLLDITNVRNPDVETGATPSATVGANGLLLNQFEPGEWHVRGFDELGRLLGQTTAFRPSGASQWTWDELGAWGSEALLVEVTWSPVAGTLPAWRGTLKHRHGQ